LTSARSDAFVLFGATGDLAYKKIFPALQAMIRSGEAAVPIIGIARGSGTIDTLRARARDSLEQNGGIDEDAFAKLSAQLAYVNGDYNDPGTYDQLRAALGAAARPLHYLAIPPSMFAPVVQGLARAGCASNARVIVEKPFGRDLASARALNATLHAVFPESAVFRIDHYLGKEAVQNLLYFRFANALLERGIYVIGFSFPVVPKGQARIRVQMSAVHEREHLERAVAAFKQAGEELGLIGGAK